VQPRSIAQRLIFSAAFWSVFVLAIAGIALSTIYARSSEQGFDQRLRIYLLEIIADLSSPNPNERSEIGQLGEPRFAVQNSGWYWQILRIDGEVRVVATSRSLYGQKLPTLLANAADQILDSRGAGYITGPEEQRLRAAERRVDLGDEGIFLVSVAGEVEELVADIFSFRAAVAITFAILAIVLLATTLLQVRFGLRPLNDLRGAVAEIREGKSERIGGNYAADIAPLAGELNLLIDTNRDILNRARTQVGNLAHALKTPLAVLTNEAGSAKTPLADKVAEQATIMRHHIDYYLNRARAAAMAGALGAATEVKPLIEGLVRAFSRIYQDRGLAIEAEVPEGLKFRGEKQDLEEMIGNLVDNSCKWAASRVRIEAALSAESGGTTFEMRVDNDGPPLSAAERAAALKRGVRLDESKPGSGLGLAIVVDLAGMYGGKAELADSPLGGVRSRLELPAI
jgi:signal transduction histidine kinase